jgi:hypothetical protein
MARLATTSFAGDVFFDKFGALVSEWVAIQLIGDGPPTDSYANYTTNVKRQDSNVSSYYQYSTIISPLEYRTGSLIYPAPTYEEREEHIGYYEGEDYEAEIAFTVLAAVMIVIILVSLIMIILWRQENGIRLAQPEFMGLALLGFAVICASIFTWQLYVTTVGCVFTAWLISTGLYFVLGSQIVRTWRVYRVMDAAAKFKKAKFPLWSSFIIFGVGYIPILVSLIVLTGRGALSAEIVVDNLRPINNYAECVLDAPDPSPELIILIAYLGLLALVWISSALISYKILHSQYALHEIVVSILCCILIIVCGIVLLLAQLLDLDRTSQYIVRCVMILTCSMSYLLAIIYKIYDTLKNGTGLMSIGSNLTNKPSSGGIGSSLDGVTSVHSSDEIASSTSVPMTSVVATNT